MTSTEETAMPTNSAIVRAGWSSTPDPVGWVCRSRGCDKFVIASRPPTCSRHPNKPMRKADPA